MDDIAFILLMLCKYTE